MTDRINVMARAEFWRLAEQAKTQGKDLAEVLDRQGFLLTPSRLKKIQADTIDDVAELLETTSPMQYTTKNTPEDFRRALASYLRDMAKEARN